MLNSITKKILLTLFVSSLFITSLPAKDRNILAYIDRGIKYYPHYVKEGLTKIGKASWYGQPFHQRLTASGERYNMYNMTAAHRTYAMNTVLKVTNLENNKSVKVRVNDRGPFYHTRDIDLSYGAAQKLGIVKQGVSKVKIEVVSSPKKSKTTTQRVVQKTQKKPEAVKRTQKVQVASFFNHASAKSFQKKHRLKNAIIVKKFIPDHQKTAYRVVVQCTPWEAKKLIQSQKFKGAFLLS
ncbi:MAG: septal ring lytic transglycosylase RlpA family protein [Campylobacterales bacterium]|nr:septal ring lytic transglycosylase RlpA family protein [Campylobacterales bacterium]